MTSSTHKFEIGQKVRHEENDMIGEIIELTCLGDVVEGDCEDDEYNQPWYVIRWNDDGEEDEDNIGQESEDSIELIE